MCVVCDYQKRQSWGEFQAGAADAAGPDGPEAAVRQIGPTRTFMDVILAGTAYGGGTVYFQFPATADQFTNEPLTGYRSLNPEQIAVVRSVFEYLNHMLAVRFVELPPGAAPPQDAALVKLGSAKLDIGIAGLGSYPNDGNVSTILFTTESDSLTFANNSAEHVFWHEIGHALGLKHPFDEFGQFPKDAAIGFGNTVMAYGMYPYFAPGYRPEGFVGYQKPLSFMPWDIAALQHLYGANPSSDGDTVFEISRVLSGYDNLHATFSHLRTSDGRSFGDASGQGWDMPGRLMVSLWDRGGQDTVSLAGVTADWGTVSEGARVRVSETRLEVFLGTGDPEYRWGTWRIETPIAAAVTFALDQRSWIETVVGSAFDDVLDAAWALRPLILKGGAGADVLVSGRGADTLEGGAGNDLFRFGRGAGHDTILDFTADGTDDRIEVWGYAAWLELRQVGGDTLVVFSATDTLLLRGVTATSLTALDFVFNAAPPAEQPAPYVPPPPIPLPPEPPQPPAPSPDSTPTVIGTEAQDILVGTGAEGGDYIRGLGGDDFINTSFRSDRIEGGAGNDQIRGGFGADVIDGGLGDDRIWGEGHNDSLTGGQGDDRLYGEAGDDVIDGDEGNDLIVGGAGSDTITGGTGVDQAVYSGLYGAYGRAGGFTDLALAGGPEGGTDTISGVETVKFLDGHLSFETDTWQAVVYRMYDAAFDRGPDPFGMKTWAEALAGGMNLSVLSDTFEASPEFQARYGHLNNTDFIKEMYRYSLNREADSAGLLHWEALMASGVSRAEVLYHFSESGEHIAVMTNRILEQGMWIQDENTIAIARLYDSVLDKLPTVSGLKTYRTQMEAGLSLAQVAQALMAQPEYQSLYGGLSNQAFVEKMYQVILNRAGTAGEVQTLTAHLDAGAGRADLLVGLSETIEHAVAYQRTWNQQVRTLENGLYSAASPGMDDKHFAEVLRGRTTTPS